MPDVFYPLRIFTLSVLLRNICRVAASGIKSTKQKNF